MKRVCLLALIALSPVSCRDQGNENNLPGWQLKPRLGDATGVSTESQLVGIYPVGSRITDSKALGGFGPCDNFPHFLGDKDWGQPGKLSLIAFPNEPVAYFKHQGIPLRIVNRSRKTAVFPAVDSQLPIVQEALDEEGKWRPIETSINANVTCGNSYHRVFLGAGQYWQVPARVYAGPFQTKLRFRLDHDGDAIYSNEFPGEIHMGQFETPKDVRGQ